MSRIITRVFRRATALLTAAILSFAMLPISVTTHALAAGDTYITEITIAQGEMCDQTLQESGYTVVPQSLNPSDGANSSALVYMGYKTGGEGSAIRDLCVSSSGSGSIKVGDFSYSKVSEISLNAGVGGKTLYLYASYDSGAGEPLRGISFQVMKTTDGISNDAPILSSDGSEIVSTDDEKVANFDEGVSGSEVYLKMYKGDIYRPYVEDMIVAKGESEEAAIKKLAGKGCTFYVNYSIGLEDDAVIVGYTRTSDKSKALTGVVAVASKEDKITIKDTEYELVDGGKIDGEDPYRLYKTTDTAAGNPIMDLVACGYDPDELDLDDEAVSGEAVSWWFGPTVAKAAEKKDESSEEADEGDGESTEKEEVDSDDGEEKSDEEEQPSGEAPKDTDAAENPSSEEESGDDTPAAENPEEEAEEEEKEEEEEEAELAKGVRVYSSIALKDWLSGYFLRGGSGATVYLYEEGNYNSAAESNDKLWISNIYGSNKKGKQFVNCLGYVTSAGEVAGDPFEKAVAYDEAEEADSTASVFSNSISLTVIAGLMLLAVIGCLIGVIIKLKKSGNS